ncbi:MAG: VWA-like domain-containing protein [Verrucomicrobiota bacterium]|nr:VWA-like domain-containing protein [Verrucomicrobiota bacterium]
MSTEKATLRIEACLVRLRTRQPFFGALALFIEHKIDKRIRTASTNGREIRFNPDFACNIKPDELDGVMVHELLHASLRHITRRGDRDPPLWNTAADIVVNGMVREVKGLELPMRPVEDASIQDLEVEEVYACLLEHAQPVLVDEDWLDLVPGGEEAFHDMEQDAERETYWSSAISRVRMLTGKEAMGKLPRQLERIVEDILEPRLDWRTLLWRFLARSPVDFQGYDRRYISRNLYLDDLEGLRLKARVCIDTSGSISSEYLAQFLAELKAIEGAYPQLDLLLYYADASLHGPFDLEDKDALRPKGGGGTDFRPFFREMRHEAHEEALLIYFTDGMSLTPSNVPEQEVLWVGVTHRKNALKMPFGGICHLV